MPNLNLRTKFLLALALISALITTGVLLIVSYRVQVRVRVELAQALDTSIIAFDRLQQQREVTLERSAALLAALPTLKALMTSDDPATIQDASTTFWQLAGSQLLVLADREGVVAGFHTAVSEFPREAAQAAVTRYLTTGESRDWWYGGGHLFQVFLQPIAFGAPESGHTLGLVAVGYEVNQSVATDVSRVAASEVAFAYDHQLVVSTLPPGEREALAALVRDASGQREAPRETALGTARFLEQTVRVSPASAPLVTLTALKSFAESEQFVDDLNRWILAIGAVGVAAGALLVFFVSTTFTRPLWNLVSGVKALERGDYAFPLDTVGEDEVGTLTAAFSRMREQLQATQHRLLEAERMATIGLMANTISHDLRHPLTAIQAYAEFLENPSLTDAQRADFTQEIRIAVNHMLDEINQLLGFSHERQALQRADIRLDELVDRAIKTVKALPEFEGVTIVSLVTAECRAWLDPGKAERVLLNLLFNAAEVVSPTTGTIEVSCASRDGGVDLRVRDNGPGIPTEIADRLFEPFVSHGKQKGTGLGLTVVHNVMQQHGGSARVEDTGPSGTTFLLHFPSAPA
ncbi:MAG: HAMP domain-containing sensor histidine kinase [Vicinamibacterales bacterium]